MYTYSQDLVSEVVAHCISYALRICSHCSRCCCCLLLCDRQCMGIRLNSARGPGLYHRSKSLSFLRLPSTPSSPWLLSISRASWHIPPVVKGTPEQNLHNKASSTMVKSPGGPGPSPKILGCNLCRQGPGFVHWHTYLGLTKQFIPQHPASSEPTR